MPNTRPERDLKDSPVFGEWEGPREFGTDSLPFPKLGESLLSDPIGSEGYIRLYEKWGFSKLEGLSFFAMFYQERARELVRAWLRSHENAENFVYPVGFLYRHCIELNMKAAIVRSSWFRDLSPKRKEKKFRTHSLAKLWGMLKPILSEFTSDDEIKPFEEQLLELERLDESSQGFRYPFGGFDHETGKPGPLLEGLVGKSFDNLVWVLDGMANWLSATADVEQEYRDNLAYEERGAEY